MQRDFRRLAAKGTLARQIIDRQSPVHILGDDISVKATIHTINGFSTHADQAELSKWLGQTGASARFLPAGEEAAMHEFASRLGKTQVEMPSLASSFICIE